MLIDGLSTVMTSMTSYDLVGRRLNDGLFREILRGVQLGEGRMYDI